MSFLDKLFHRIKNGQKHIFVPFDDMDLTTLEGKGKIGYSTPFDKLYSRGRRSNPIVQNMNDYVQWLFYDKATFTAAGGVPVNFKLFTTPIGQGTGFSGSKTKVETNLDQPQRINDPGWLNAIGIGFFFAPNVLLADIQNFLDQAYMEFWVGGKIYLEGPHIAFPGGAGLTGVSTDTAQQTFSSGIARLSNMFDLRLPAGMPLGKNDAGQRVIADGLTGVTILQTQLLKVENNLPNGALTLTAANAVPNPGTGFRMSSYLIGTYSRGVQ